MLYFTSTPALTKLNVTALPSFSFLSQFFLFIKCFGTALPLKTMALTMSCGCIFILNSLPSGKKYWLSNSSSFSLQYNKVLPWNLLFSLNAVSRRNTPAIKSIPLG